MHAHHTMAGNASGANEASAATAETDKGNASKEFLKLKERLDKELAANALDFENPPTAGFSKFLPKPNPEEPDLMYWVHE